MPSGRRVSAAQLGVMLDWLEVHPLQASGSQLGGYQSKRTTQVLWEELASQLNAVGDGATKSTREWRQYWSDLKCKIGRKGSTIIGHGCGTEGGPAYPSILTPTEERILSLLGVQSVLGNANVRVHYWSDLKSKTRKKAFHMLQQPSGMGGGPALIGILGPFEDRVQKLSSIRNVDNGTVHVHVDIDSNDSPLPAVLPPQPALSTLDVAARENPGNTSKACPSLSTREMEKRRIRKHKIRRKLEVRQTVMEGRRLAIDERRLAIDERRLAIDERRLALEEERLVINERRLALLEDRFEQDRTWQRDLISAINKLADSM